MPFITLLVLLTYGLLAGADFERRVDIDGLQQPLSEAYGRATSDLRSANDRLALAFNDFGAAVRLEDSAACIAAHRQVGAAIADCLAVLDRCSSRLTNAGLGLMETRRMVWDAMGHSHPDASLAALQRRRSDLVAKIQQASSSFDRECAEINLQGVTDSLDAIDAARQPALDAQQAIAEALDAWSLIHCRIVAETGVVRVVIEEIWKSYEKMRSDVTQLTGVAAALTSMARSNAQLAAVRQRQADLFANLRRTIASQRLDLHPRLEAMRATIERIPSVADTRKRVAALVATAP